MVGVTPLLPKVDFAIDDLPDLHEVLAELRALGPISPIAFAGQTIWLVNDYEQVRRFISDDEFLSAPAAYEIIVKPSMGTVLPTMAGAQHRRNRAVVSKVFQPAKMKDFAEKVFCKEAHLLAEPLRDQDRVDLVSEFTRSYTFNNIARMLGLPLEDVRQLQQWADAIMRAFVEPEAARRAGQEIGDHLLPLVQTRRAAPSNDLLSLLVHTRAEGEGISDEEVISFCRNLFPAAIDTSTNSLGSLLAHALGDRDLWRQAATSASCRESAIEELLRWEPPLVMLPRRCVKPVRVGGYDLEVGDDVRLCVAGAHDDPTVYPDPRAFRTGRAARNLTFGHGEHFCLGTQMARRVLDSGLRVLAERFPHMTLSPGELPQITGGVLRGPRSLWVRPGG